VDSEFPDGLRVRARESIPAHCRFADLDLYAHADICFFLLSMILPQVQKRKNYNWREAAELNHCAFRKHTLEFKASCRPSAVPPMAESGRVELPPFITGSRFPAGSGSTPLRSR